MRRFSYLDLFILVESGVMDVTPRYALRWTKTEAERAAESRICELTQSTSLFFSSLLEEVHTEESKLSDIEVRVLFSSSTFPC